MLDCATAGADVFGPTTLASSGHLSGSSYVQQAELANSSSSPAMAATWPSTACSAANRGIFRRDLESGEIAVVAEGDAVRPSISADGRYISFTTTARLDEENDTNRAPDVYVRDMSIPSAAPCGSDWEQEGEQCPFTIASAVDGSAQGLSYEYPAALYAPASRTGIQQGALRRIRHRPLGTQRERARGRIHHDGGLRPRRTGRRAPAAHAGAGTQPRHQTHGTDQHDLQQRNPDRGTGVRRSRGGVRGLHQRAASLPGRIRGRRDQRRRQYGRVAWDGRRPAGPVPVRRRARRRLYGAALAPGWRTRLPHPEDHGRLRPTRPRVPGQRRDRRTGAGEPLRSVSGTVRYHRRPVRKPARAVDGGTQWNYVPQLSADGSGSRSSPPPATSPAAKNCARRKRRTTSTRQTCRAGPRAYRRPSGSPNSPAAASTTRPAPTRSWTSASPRKGPRSRSRARARSSRSARRRS